MAQITAASPVPSPNTSSAASKPDDGCPATEASLLKATGSKNAAAAKLTRIVCHDGWAIAGYGVPGYDSEVRTYQYEAGTWHYFIGGSGGHCAAFRRTSRSPSSPRAGPAAPTDERT